MGNSFILIVIGLLLFYLVISDKWYCVEGFLACVLGRSNAKAGLGGNVQEQVTPNVDGSVNINPRRR